MSQQCRNFRCDITSMGEAMPTLAKELRREVCESIDDIIKDLGAIGR